jgi:hypothetical protein
MTHTITKDIYTIKYNMTDTILTIGITNKDTLQKYSSIKTSDEYCIYSGLGINIFDIVDKLFVKGTFNIVDTIDNIIIEFAIGSIKIPIQCEANTYSKEEVEDSELRSVINAMRKTLDTTVRELSDSKKTLKTTVEQMLEITKELNDYKKTLDITVKQLNDQQKYIDCVVRPYMTKNYTRTTPPKMALKTGCLLCKGLSDGCPNCFTR